MATLEKSLTQQLSNSAMAELETVQKNFASLAKDPYTSPDNNRFRAYSNAIIFPWEREVFWIPTEIKNGQHVSSYWQGSFNPEHKGATRSFTPLNSTVKKTSLVNNLILHDFDLTFWDQNYGNLPIYVGIHFVKLQVLDPNEIAYSSPDLMHQDGEAFTFAHLFNRNNVKGGANYISTPQWANHKLEDIKKDDILAEFEMHHAFESYGVCDNLVSHYVSPIELDDKEQSQGSREIILIDFSLMQQWLG